MLSVYVVIRSYAFTIDAWGMAVGGSMGGLVGMKWGMAVGGSMGGLVGMKWYWGVR